MTSAGATSKAQTPRLTGLYLFVADLPATSAFYAALGLQIEAVSAMFARATWSGEVVLEFGTEVLTRSYDPGFRIPGSLSKATFNFELASRDAVDAKFAALVGAGYTGHLPPCDPPWQARFAIVADPDGNFVGLHSPRDRAQERLQEKD